MKNVIQITDKILGVIVDENAYDFEFIHDKIRIGYKVDYRLFKIDLPKGEFKIHGTCILPAFDFDFEVNEGLVEKFEIKNIGTFGYIDYIKFKVVDGKNYQCQCSTKEESFRTCIQKAIQDEGMFFVNPYGENRPQELVDYTGRKDGIIANSLDIERWQSAESKTVKKLLLIEKI